MVARHLNEAAPGEGLVPATESNQWEGGRVPSLPLVSSDSGLQGLSPRRDLERERVNASPVSRRADIARGYCRGCRTPGRAVWCRLCRWSPSYFRAEEIHRVS